MLCYKAVNVTTRYHIAGRRATEIASSVERGIRDGSDSQAGKTIVFARNHNHAVLLQNLFDEMYPQYGGKFCRVIDNYDPRAEELIDEFKDVYSDLTIAISARAPRVSDEGRVGVLAWPIRV